MINNKKSVLQKSAVYFSIASFILSIVCAVFLLLKVNDLGWDNPVSASFLASVFFFIFVSVVLMIIGTANLPSFKVGKQD